MPGTDSIHTGDRVFYFERLSPNLDCSGFGLVIEIVKGQSEKYPYTKKHIDEQKIGKRIFLILKDSGELEEFLETDCKKVLEI